MTNYEDAVAFLGQWGRFQQVIFFLLCATILPNGFGGFSLVFLSDIPSHSCFVSEDNLTEDWRESIIPVTLLIEVALWSSLQHLLISFLPPHLLLSHMIVVDQLIFTFFCISIMSVVVDGLPQQSKCSRYRLDVVKGLSAKGLIPGKDINLTDLEEEPCVDGWSYSKDVYQSTIVTEFNLVCNEQWKHPLTTVVFFVGVFCGSLFSGHMSDRFGRKPILFLTIGFQTVFTFIQSFSTSWIMFLIILFFSGLGQMSNFVSALVLGAELFTGNIRVLYSSLGSNLAFAIGYMLLPLCAYFFRDWQTLLLVLSVPCLIYTPLWWVIPESPRWLLSQGRVKEAEAIIEKAAKWNKVETPRFIFADCNINSSQNEEKRYNVWDLLRIKKMRLLTILLSLVWFSANVTYYSISYNTSQLHTDPYISCFISAAIEVPGYISSWLALLHLPRRLSIVCTFIFSAVPLYIIQLVPRNFSALALTLEMIAKFFITTAFSLMFAITTELYPTILRNTATSLTSTISRMGSCLGPFLLSLSFYHKYLPYNILATLTLLSIIAALFLPESFKQPLPESIDEMQDCAGRKICCVTGKKIPVPVDLPNGQS